MPWNPIHSIQNGKKKCINCKNELPLDQFSPQKRCKEGIRPNCKSCINKKNKLYYDKNREVILIKTRAYGQTEYRKKYCRDLAKLKLKEKREKNSDRPRPNECEGCNGLPGKQGIVWDHNHNTGKFRGWLCNRCNRVLGMCNDSINILNGLKNYLENYG